MPRRFLITALATLTFALPAHSGEVVVFAAASLKSALDAVAAGFEAGTGNTVSISYGGTSQMAKQIMAGAPADIFIPASREWMDEVEAAGLVAAGTRRDLLGNGLVLVAHGAGAKPVAVGAGFDLAGLVGDGKLAMAMVDSVPAGQYGKQSLVALGVWGAVEGSVVQTENVRAALALVAAGEAAYGIVYTSDAVAEAGVSVVATFPADSHEPIVYPVALLTGATDEADREFLAALSTEAASGLFAAQGFAVLK